MREIVADPELLSFASEVLEANGGAIERQEKRIQALLPSELAQRLDLPEEASLGADGALLLYGAPLLDRLIGLATREVPVVYGNIQIPYLKKAGFEQLIGRDVIFADGQVRVSGRAEARTTYMVLVCHYMALSDERKEGLVRVGVHETSGALIEGIEDLWREMTPEFYPAGKTPPHFPIHLEQAVSSALKSAKASTERELSEFLSSMRRRLRRDVKNTREYYSALKEEMEASLSHPNLTESQRDERIAKMKDLPEEMASKVRDLEQKYRVQVNISSRAAMRFLVDIAQVMIELKYRKLHRSIRLIWNPVTRRLDPLVCERCHETTTRVHPTAKGSEIELLCSTCSRK